MTKRNFEKIRRLVSVPFYPDPNPHIEVSPFKDQKEEFISTIPTDQTIDPAFQSRLKYLGSLVKHVASEIYSAKSSESQKKIFLNYGIYMKQFLLTTMSKTIMAPNFIERSSK